MIKPISQLTPALLALSIASVLTGCNDDSDSTKDVTINFAATVGDQTYSCGETYNVGTSTQTTQINDYRLFVSNVRMVKADGSEESVELTQDETWQYENVALLDFDNGCANGTESTNTSISGSVDNSTYTGICFDLGVPFDLNHLDNASQPSPLNASGMFWNWQAGYKFVRIDMKGDPGEGDGFANQGFNIHLGSTGCTSDSKQTSPTAACTNPNRPTICLDAFDPESQTISFDAAGILMESDTTSNTPDTAPGCMSGNNDPECQTILPRLGLDFVYNDGSGADPITFEKQAQSFATAVDTH